MIGRWLHGTLVASLLLALVGCGGTKTLTDPVTPTAFAPSTMEQPVLLPLAAGDKVRVTVYGEDRISGEYQIDPDGIISLPLAGTLKAAGLERSRRLKQRSPTS